MSFFLALAACGYDGLSSFNNESNTPSQDQSQEMPISEDPLKEPESLSYIPFTWDGKHQDSELWTQFTHEALESLGQDLLDSRPSDIQTFCPNYDKLDRDGRLMFWIHLISSMTKYESSFNPETSYKENFRDRFGEYIYSRGLLQLSIESGQGYGCPLNDAQELHDPQTNLECGVRIMNLWVKRDGRLAGKSSRSGKWQGGARYWAVLRQRSYSSPYDSIVQLTKKSEVCLN